MTFDDGDVLETEINGTEWEIATYYLHNKFVLPDEVTFHHPVKVEFLESGVEIVRLKNNRMYRIIDTKKPYQSGEYPSGGFTISTCIHKNFWSYLDNSPDRETLNNFLEALARNSVL